MAFQLNSLGRQIKNHWAEFRPKMTADLQKADLLDRAVHEAQQRTGEALSDALQSGESYAEAWPKLREQWAFLPSEEEQPILASGNPGTWLAPASKADSTTT